MIGDSNDKGNFPHELLLTERQVSSIHKTFANNSSVDIKFSKTQLSKNVITPLAKSILIPLGLTAAASTADAGIHKKILGSDDRCHSSFSALHNTTPII